jgi:hypothetical protein
VCAPLPHPTHTPYLCTSSNESPVSLYVRARVQYILVGLLMMVVSADYFRCDSLLFYCWTSFCRLF